MINHPKMTKDHLRRGIMIVMKAHMKELREKIFLLQECSL
jgi:hypothetical protein